MLEHASAAMTLDVYADLFESDLDTVADRLENVKVLTGRKLASLFGAKNASTSVYMPR